MSMKLSDKIRNHKKYPTYIEQAKWADEVAAIEDALIFADKLNDAAQKRINELEKENGELSKIIDEYEYMATRGTT